MRGLLTGLLLLILTGCTVHKVVGPDEAGVCEITAVIGEPVAIDRSCEYLVITAVVP